MTLFLINGPPRSGKDSAATCLAQLLLGYSLSHWKLADELKVRCHAMYRLTDSTGRPWRAEFYESNKEVPSDDFLGLSPRAAYIAFHERYLKPVHGPRILGELLVENMSRSLYFDSKYLVVSDAGDAEQCAPLLELCGADHTVLIHLSRAGFPWSDNRVRFDLPGVRTVEVENPGTTLADLRVALLPCLS